MPMFINRSGDHIWPVALIGLLLSGCGQQSGETYPVFDEPELKLGREVWLANCQACHGPGIVGAPQFGNREAWAPRIQQGMEVLFDHALNGFSGKTGTEMPARGGNSELEDAPVKAAVRYMVQASQ